MKKLSIIFIFSLVISCKRTDNILEITTSTGARAHNSILYLVESANVSLLKDSVDLMKYLSANQMKIAFDSIVDSSIIPPKFRIYEFKFYKTILKTAKYQTDLLLTIDNSLIGRNYFFKLRSYDKNRSITGHLDFASWSDHFKSHWTGEVSNDTIVKIKCDETGEWRRFKISETGEFIFFDSNKNDD